MRTNEADVLHVPDIARMLGRTEAAVRAGLNRRVDWLPPHFPLGRRIVWRRATVEAWLAERERAGAPVKA